MSIRNQLISSLFIMLCFAVATKPVCAKTDGGPSRDASQLSIAASKATEKNEGKELPKKTPQKKVVDMTPAELAERIKDVLLPVPEAVNSIPGLKKMKDEKGNEFYTFKGKDLETLPKSELQSILNMALNETARIRAEKINMQLDMIRRSQAAVAAAQQSSRISVPAAPPQPPRQPIVSAPQQQQIPKPPSQPALPPQQRRY
jgi:hypothetical protein